jgi:manganese transport protein
MLTAGHAPLDLERRDPSTRWRRWRRSLAFLGPGLLVAVGYVDPGNWSTDLAAGSQFGYLLLGVVILSSGAAMLMQSLSARLGVASGLDLAQATRWLHPRAVIPLWLLAELAMVATDLAEVLGAAIALQLLFGLPLVAGVLLTGLDVLIFLGLARSGWRGVEAVVGALLAVVAACLVFELVLARPDPAAVARGLIPDFRGLAHPEVLYVGIGIVGATIMPHNLYLHSALVRSSEAPGDTRAARRTIREATLGSVVTLSGAMLVNAAILLLAAAAFHGNGQRDVVDFSQAYRLLAPVLGSAVAAPIFAVALLAAGQSATITGTMAGQVVVSGFLNLQLQPWVRRLVTRGLALVPALAVIAFAGERSVTSLLIGSQVVLSMQLPFAMVPLLRATAHPGLMGSLASPRWLRAAGWITTAVIVTMNAALLWLIARGGWA